MGDRDYNPEATIARSEEHGRLRTGRVTGSKIRIIMRGTIKSRNNLLNRFDKPEVFYTVENTPNMPAQLRWGHVYEPWLRAEFWERHPEYDIVTTDPFVRPGQGQYGAREDLPWPVLEHVGVSPDAILVRLDGQISGWEGKNPYRQQSVVSAIDHGVWESKWLDQVDLNMLATGADHWWLCVGDSREPDGSRFRYHEIRIERDEERMTTMVTKICEFIEYWKTGQRFAEPGVRARMDALGDLL